MIREFQKRSRYLIAPLLGSIALVYVSYQGVQGDRGLLAWIQRGQEVVLAEENFALQQEKRDALAHRVLLLKADTLDLDLLDERAREVLNLVKPEDLVLLKKTGAH